MGYETERQLIDRGVLTPTPLQPADCFRPRRLLIQWNITDRCNLTCAHCYRPATPSAETIVDSNQADCLGILQKIQRLYQQWDIPGHVTLSGGEPLCSPWFWTIANELAAWRPRIGFSVLTNGTQITSAVCRGLKKLGCGFVQVSLDGGQATHDRLRGPGSFALASRALRQLGKVNLSSMVSFTCSAENASEFPAVAKLCRSLKVDVLWSDRLIPTGQGNGLGLLQPPEVAAYFQSMAGSCPKGLAAWFNPTTIRMHRALQFHALATRGVPYQPYSCNAGRGLLSILPNGDVVPCRRLPIVVGNILTDDLATLYAASPLLRQLRQPQSIPAECGGCASREVCRGGLRCLAYSYFGTPFKADPQCFMLYQQLPPKELAHA